MKILKRSVLCAVSALVVTVSIAQAHHAVQAQFDVKDIQSFTGMMTKSGADQPTSVLPSGRGDG